MHGKIYDLSLLPEKSREPVNRVGEGHLIENTLSLPGEAHCLGEVHFVLSIC